MHEPQRERVRNRRDGCLVLLDDVLDRVRWANAHPDEVAAIARRGAAFAKQHLHTHTVACYWWQLLTEWAAMQSFHARATIGTRFN